MKDLILYNGHFYNGAADWDTASAVYCRNGVIVAMGSDEDMLSMPACGQAEETETYDLQGHYVMPGFIDSHMHLLDFAEQEKMVHLEAARSFEDVIALCGAQIEQAKKNNKWIRAVGFNENDWGQDDFPTRKDLDRISTEVPVTIRRVCLHVSVCNTRALEVMGLLEHPPIENLENFGFFEDGTLNGVIKEFSQELINDVLPPLTKEEIKELIVYGCEKAAEKGIVEIHTDDFHSTPWEHGETVLEAYHELVAEEKLPLRINEQCYLPDEEGLDVFLKQGHYTGETDGLFKVGPLKIILDGSLGSHTAWMRADYKNEEGQRGVRYYDEAALYHLAKKAHDAGMQIAVHAIGDASLQQMLDIYERIQWENPRADCRHGMVHCQIMDRMQQDRFKQMNLLGYVQPVFLRYDMNIVDECVGTELAAQSYNWRRFLDQGVHLSGGSDCPVESFDIMQNIQYAVSRTDFSTGKSWYPENAVSMEEAVRMFTWEGAYASFAEQTRGSIEIGKEADFAVLSKDLFREPVEKINQIKTLMTIVKGNVVFDAER
ncbi:amidohydrolase [uncultured Eubacterium sp.]|uniref:amidohydrolase n=1 Tax=uncultured Eubacterium sp. TaxID=165185 RepID=UPI0025F933A9|nr:amidohydrolase [uncultured Eubacterium sp.]MCI6537187.1 amidohydrolase [Lachnospiraceae bacterium]